MNYKNIYCSLIHRCQTRQQLPEQYEIHHIIPVSVGGSDFDLNLVKMTPREHYLAHILLWRIYRSTRYGMTMKKCFIAMMMTGSECTKRGYKPSDRIVNFVRKWNYQSFSNRKTMIEIDGVIGDISYWSNISGNKESTILSRIRHGWSEKEAVFKSPLNIYYVNGVGMTLTEMSKKYNIAYEVIYQRIIQRKMKPEDAIKVTQKKVKIVKEKIRPQKFSYKNELLSIRELSEKYNIEKDCLRQRLKVYNMSVDEAIEKPKHAKKFKKSG